MTFAAVRDGASPVPVTDDAPLEQQIAAHYAAGASLKATRNHFAVSEHQVRRALDACGVAVRPLPREGSQYSLAGKEKQIIARAQRGESLRQIARSLGVGHEVVRKLLVRNGVERLPPRRPEEPPSAGDQVHMVARYEAGESVQRLAESMGRSEPWVRKYLKRAGVELRASGDYYEEEQQRYKEIADRVRDGAKMRQVMDEFGIGPGVFTKALRVEGVKANVYLTDDQIEQAVGHFREHGSLTDAAAHAGMSVVSARRYLRERGILSPPGTRTAGLRYRPDRDQEYETALRVLEETGSIRKAAEAAGVSYQTAYRRFVKAGVDLPAQGCGRPRKKK